MPALKKLQWNPLHPNFMGVRFEEEEGFYTDESLGRRKEEQRKAFKVAIEESMKGNEFRFTIEILYPRETWRFFQEGWGGEEYKICNTIEDVKDGPLCFFLPEE